MQLPFSKSTHFLEHWLEPVIEFGEADIKKSWAYDNKWLLLGLAVVIALVGISAAIAVYAKKKVKAIEPAILADAWRYDSAVSALVGGPGRAAFNGLALFDAKVVDGAVNGAGTVTRTTSGVVRKVQTGFVRSYAVILSVGVLLVLAWFLLRGVSA